MMRLLRPTAYMTIIVAMVVGSTQRQFLGLKAREGANANNRTDVQSHRDDIESLLKRLFQGETKEGDKTVISAPSIETQQDVHDSLLKIASQAPESRSEVVDALLKILEDPQAREESPVAYRWTVAVQVLGELRAIEAIDPLISNLDQTGQKDIFISMSYHPVAKALATIGEPSIPQLVGALTSRNQVIRSQAASALARIGYPALGQVIEALRAGDVRIRGGAALALARIGGEDARAAIEHAIEHEEDMDVLKELKDAIREMHRLWRGAEPRINR